VPCRTDGRSVVFGSIELNRRGFLEKRIPYFAPPLEVGVEPCHSLVRAAFPFEATGAEHIVPEVVTACDGAGSQSNGPFPTEFQALVDDPNSLLRSAIAGQNILGTITIELQTGLGTNLSNIPFLGTPNPAQPSNPLNTPNAFVYSSAATFWIEWVQVPNQSRQPQGTDPTLQSIEPFWPTRRFCNCSTAGVDPGFQQRIVAAR
jgi:hypothetical protein